MLKRKRKMLKEGSGGEEEEVFKESKKTPRSPGDRKEGGENIGEQIREVIREEFKLLLERVNERIIEQVRRLTEEVERMREEIREQERKGREERMELRVRVEGLERKMEEMELGNREGREREGITEGDRRGWEEKLGEIERRIEWKDREERRKNIMIRGIEVKERRRREAVEKLIEKIGAQVEILEDWRVSFWNVAGLHNKDEGFWRSLKEWDLMVLSETWVEGGGWQKLKGKLPKGYV
ncbi:hypothetical protein X777_14458 [Ooceraea biroi]|uniref:Endonuclease/exonuclease/phosphatase domain-containing protein n=1 Tax=Ooceraea biroi TaxID=2015173 RepID=A0A026VW84_OOCBI|nr:hypothetical protein X777_14458 [Ooceraea biroi]